jgi:hypothetical protein
MAPKGANLLRLATYGAQRYNVTIYENRREAK